MDRLRRPNNPTLIQEQRSVVPIPTEAETMKNLAQEKLSRVSRENTSSQHGQASESSSGDNLLEEGSTAEDKKKKESATTSSPATPTFDLEQVQQMIDGAIGKAIESVQAQHQKEVDRLQNQLSEKELAHQKETEELASQIEAANTSAKSQASEYQKQIDKATETISKFNDLYKLTGAKTPVQDGAYKPSNSIRGTAPYQNGTHSVVGANVNRYTSPTGEKLTGAIAECLQIVSRSPKVLKLTGRGNSYYHTDTTELDRYVRQNRSQVIREMDAWGRKHGLFQGGRRTVVTEAATTIPDIPGGFLEVLSSLMRTSHRPGYVFWQLVNTRVEFDKGMGDTIQIPRAAYQPPPGSPDDRLLSGGGTFARTVNDGQNLSTGIVPAQIQEWGLGKDANSAPVEVPSFVSAYSIIDLMQILERNLMYDYYSWEDLKIRSLWSPTSRIVYNNNDFITTAPGDVAAGSVGTLTRGFLTNLYAEMQGNLTPTLPDGCYFLALHTKALAQLQNDFDKYWNPPTPNDLQQFVNMFNYSMYEGDSARVSGYHGQHCNFHIFATNSFSLGAPGTEGVQTETLGVGATTTRTSYAAGIDTIGRGIGTPMQIRKDTNDDFQRLGRYIWRSEEGFVAMDVDPVGYNDTSTVPQQLRVFQVRTTDVEV
ncbi:MAG: hypothetical protein QNJ41_12100 [Xenococcaceae cyanobacterium MO_188.B32]|nr:hypothetical protein [Xenococcaceae cyanobacterium MO_188.B32]